VKTTGKKTTAVAVLGLGFAMLAGCGTGDRVRDVYNEHRTDTLVDSGELTEGEVYNAARALNDRELEAIGAVQGRIDDPAIQEYAALVEKQHREALTKLDTLGKEIEGTEVERDLTREIRDESRADAKELSDVRGDDLDGEFLEKMVDSHQRALAIIDNHLLPSAKGELVQFVSEMRTHVTQHLRQAEDLREDLDD
jgi:predicted outer membrane protein